MTRKSIIISSTVIITLIALVIILFHFLQFNRYKTPIEQQISQAIGRQLSINGDLKIMPGSHLTVTANNVTLANAKWGKYPEVASINSLSIELPWRPLLSGNIVVNKVIIKDAKLYLEENWQGKGNWEFSSSETNTNNSSVNINKLKFSTNDILIHYKSTPSAKPITIDFTDSSGLIHLSEQVFKITTSGKVQKNPFSFNAHINNIDKDNFKEIDIKGKILKETFQAKGNFRSPGNHQWLKLDFTTQGERFAKLIFSPEYTFGHFKFKGKISANHHLLRFSNIEGELLKGKIYSNGSINFNGETPSYSINLTAHKISVEKLLKGLKLSNNFTHGTLSTQINLTAYGLTAQTIIKSLNGKYRIAAENAKYKHKGHPISNDFLSLLAGKDKSGNINIICLVSTGLIKDGILNLNPIIFNTKGAQVAGKGSVNLNNEKISLRFRSLGRGISLAHIAIPVHIIGSISKPVILPDTEGVVKGVFTHLADFVKRSSDLIGIKNLGPITDLANSKEIKTCINLIKQK